MARLVRDQRGIAAIEYGLIAALVVLAMMATFIQLGTVSTATWTRIVSSFPEWTRLA
jgi:Flp pilus assembly pilin Flp